LQVSDASFKDDCIVKPFLSQFLEPVARISPLRIRAFGGWRKENWISVWLRAGYRGVAAGRGVLASWTSLYKAERVWLKIETQLEHSAAFTRLCKIHICGLYTSEVTP
jgi:hypothetical protein